VESRKHDHHARYRVWPTLAATVAGVALISYVALLLVRQVSDEMLARYQREQRIAVSQQAARLVVELAALERDLIHLGQHAGLLEFDEDEVRDLLREFRKRHEGFVDGAVLMDDACVMRYVEGKDRSGEGVSIGHQEHIERLVRTLRPVVSGSFLTVEGAHAVAVHAPIIREGDFRGSVATVVRWEGFEAWGRRARTAPAALK
jgi:heme exporter protein D